MFPFCYIFLSMEDTQEIFVAGIEVLIRREKKRRKSIGQKFKQSEIADYLNVSPASLSGFLRFHRNYGDEKRKQLSEFFGYSYIDVLIIGRQELIKQGKEIDIDDIISSQQPPSTPKPEPKEKEKACPTCGQVKDIKIERDKQHENIIQQFSNTKLARKINQMLVQIEKDYGDDGLEDACFEIEKLIENFERKKTGTVRRNGTTNSV